MKAKDLAALLLQTPDLDVFVEDYHSPDFDEGYYYTNTTTGITRTPDGIFINIETLDRNIPDPKAPSEKPKINTIAIKMKDDKWFKLSLNDHNISVLRDFNEYGYICHYIGWHDDYYVLAADDCPEEYIQEKINDSSSTHYTPEQVDYVQILVGLDEVTWNPIYIQLSFDEAIKYAVEKQ